MNRTDASCYRVETHNPKFGYENCKWSCKEILFVSRSAAQSDYYRFPIFLQQARASETFSEVYNSQRPRQALNGRYPGELHTSSARQCTPPEEPNYPFHDTAVRVTQCGRIFTGRRKINLSTVFAGQFVCVREGADDVWLVSFMDYNLGLFDRENNRVEPVSANPFAPKVLPIIPE